MSPKYAVVFLMMAATMVVLASLHGGLALLWLWPAISFGVVAAGYAGLGPRVFGKRSDGSRALWAEVVLLPFLALVLLIYHLRRMIARGPCCQQVLPGLWLGRRPQPHEIPPDVELVVDLTAEMHEPRRIPAAREYVCFPILDATSPTLDEVRAILEAMNSCRGSVYLHCAAGHGRSATIAACVMIQRGQASTVEEAETHLRRIRPGVTLNRAQRSLIRTFTSVQTSGS
jgi:protein-tyrosine phosphatase